MKAVIVYHSDYGNTEKMAEGIAAGLRTTGMDVVLQPAEQFETDVLRDADLIVFGTPVHMGSMSWQMKQVVDRAGKLWMEGALVGKFAGVFATGGGFGGAGGGVETTMIALHANFLEHGMLVIGFPKSLPGYADGGLQWGAYGRSGQHDGMPAAISEGALVAARSYGAHLAETVMRLSRGAQ